MRKQILAAIAITGVLGLSACGSNTKTTSTTAAKAETTTAQAETSTEAETTTTQNETSTEAETATVQTEISTEENTTENTTDAPDSTEDETEKESDNQANSDASGTLTVYTSLPQSVTDALFEAFKEQYEGIEVELISAGGGELVSRISAESENPQGDVLLSGTISAMSSYSDLFADYITVNEDSVLEGYENIEGNMTRFDVIGSVLMINTDLIGDIEVNGYADLLNPELKGKIAMADPSSSSSAYEHVVNMMAANGGVDSEEGWEYVQAFCEQLDGKLLSGSSAVYKGVMEGEYVVGLTSEGSAANCIAAGADNVAIVYMEEGVIFRGDGVYLIKDCKNEENAKLFMDFCTSYDVQKLCSDELCMRTVRSDIPASGILPAMADITVITDDPDQAAENKKIYIEKFTDIFTDL